MTQGARTRRVCQGRFLTFFEMSESGGKDGRHSPPLPMGLESQKSLEPTMVRSLPYPFLRVFKGTYGHHPIPETWTDNVPGSRVYQSFAHDEKNIANPPNF